MSRHSKGDLQQMQSLPLEAKILMTQRRIRDWVDYWHGDVYVSFSGGKDSTVLKHIVDGMYDDIPAVFVNTGLEYPEIQKFVRDVKAGKYSCFNSDVEIIRPEMRFDEVIRVHGFPVVSKVVSKRVEEARSAIENGKPDAVCVQQIEGCYLTPDGTKSPYNYGKWHFLIDAPFKISHKCCNVMKKKPFKVYEKRTARKPFIGTMAHESKLRLDKWMQNGCNAFDAKKPISQPMAFWTEQDVLHYIKRFDVPYCPVYGEIRVAQHDTIEGQINIIDYLGDYEAEDILETSGCDRTGCMFCMFGCHLEKAPNRFQRMKVTHPKQYAYCMEQLGLKEVLEYIGSRMSSKRIGLIDVDGHNYPNIPLMKISAWHKAQGDQVEWYDPMFSGHMDKVYMSKVFSFTPDYQYFIDADEVIQGGSGYCISLVDGKEAFDKSKDIPLPDEIEHIFPDYSLYGITDTAYGFLTRGCPRGCSFCHVEAKEGRASRKVADLSEFWNGQKNIVLCDPNILACRQWKELLQQLIDSGAKVDFNQGLDIRLMTPEKAEMLKQIRTKELHFAWDRWEDRDIIIPKFRMFKEITGIRERDLIVYVLCNFDTTLEQDLARIYTLRDLGYWAYVMLYDKEHIPKGHIYRKLQRWCNNRIIFANCKTFDEYLGR